MLQCGEFVRANLRFWLKFRCRKMAAPLNPPIQSPDGALVNLEVNPEGPFRAAPRLLRPTRALHHITLPPVLKKL